VIYKVPPAIWVKRERTPFGKYVIFFLHIDSFIREGHPTFSGKGPRTPFRTIPIYYTGYGSPYTRGEGAFQRFIQFLLHTEHRYRYPLLFFEKEPHSIFGVLLFSAPSILDN